MNSAPRANCGVATRLGTALLLSAVLAGCQQEPATTSVAPSAPPTTKESTATAYAAVTGERITEADKEPGQWLSHGRTYDEQRFSPLKMINDTNVDQLGLDWYFDFPTNRGMEATPLFVDGVIYTTSSWSMVYAFDARSGELLWHYDPEVPKAWMVNLCCDAVNRGVAVWQGRVYVGTIDGRLVALDAGTGSELWDIQTTPRDKPYSITGAPRVVKGKVLIGNGGSELGVRGYISAYDAESGELAWRFYTVPGDPDKPFENPILEKAAATWTGDSYWEIGGGGTVWDSMAYDPELDLLYFGVGNGAPWNRLVRSPGGGDNLFLSSIVAVRPDTGEYVWHYQTTPGESWDYTATQHMILADIEIDGKTRQVIMQAPKNGFFYVIDRANGKLVSAEKYTKVTWASHVDLATGRPVETENARYDKGEPVLLYPNTQGGHNWHPMSYSPLTGLVYIPAHQGLMNYAHDENFAFKPGAWNTGLDLMPAVTPDDPELRTKVLAEFTGFITAWDPVKQKEAWRVPHTTLWNGGMLSTAGNLLFQGNADGEFVAYRADTGEQLWSSPAHTGIVAAPITYSIDGKQYVAVVSGWGGALVAFGEIAGRAAGSTLAGSSNNSRLLVFSLDGEQALPVPEPQQLRLPQPPPLTADAATIEEGHETFVNYCHFCHGDRAVSGSSIPDLRFMSPETHEQFLAIVLGGLRHERGMAGFADRLDAQDAEAIHAYLIHRAHETRDEMQAAE
ncbi:PQQ-dependent dehydrogenase, methanol/ethanol family [Seongchinamella sediminis]|uniref:PQQ-dependent dehydrogenase, methanol/ethanol family n=1 Tax=Seongchinamella sediminis TaxID=2283635 RepID=A0A3L7DXQ9_9GAMM|nr:PQQ-dependent dehydrogenase, methanol/ethanol family [Seongchinamella sediminis]RLQ22377.1 PQQ-dependent dehydrogenase, methanol/ethanol family [Seongchinamella sediminis]